MSRNIFILEIVLLRFTSVLAISDMSRSIELYKSEPLKKCVEDKDCNTSDDGTAIPEYCYIRTGYCAHCEDCSRYFQKNVVECAQDRSACGDCQTGYIEDPSHQSINDAVKNCILQEVNHSEVEQYGWIFGCIIVTLFTLCILICYACYKKIIAKVKKISGNAVILSLNSLIDGEATGLSDVVDSQPAQRTINENSPFVTDEVPSTLNRNNPESIIEMQEL